MPLARKIEKKLTYADYIAWPDDERWELIDGEAYDMTPAPTTRHQSIVYNISFLLRSKLLDKACRAFVAPTDIVFSEHDVVQPDLFVVCDKTKITEASIQGPPDLIIEVSSPSTALKDRREKKALYEKHGVREYIIVDPAGQYVERFVAGEDGHYARGDILGTREVLNIAVLEDVTIPLWEVFEVAGPEEV